MPSWLTKKSEAQYCRLVESLPIVNGHKIPQKIEERFRNITVQTFANIFMIPLNVKWVSWGNISCGFRAIWKPRSLCSFCYSSHPIQSNHLRLQGHNRWGDSEIFTGRKLLTGSEKENFKVRKTSNLEKIPPLQGQVFDWNIFYLFLRFWFW